MLIFFGQSLNYGYAEVKNLIDAFDYSNLSEEEIKEEVELLYKYAKKSYVDNDFETAKLLLYQILELDPDHPGANKYIDFIIPKKISKIKYVETKKEQSLLEDTKELEFKRRQNVLQSAREQIELIEKERKNRETILRKRLSILEQDATLRRKFEIQDEKGIEDKKKKKEEVLEKEQEVLEGETLEEDESRDTQEKKVIEEIEKDSELNQDKVVKEYQETSQTKEQQIEKKRKQKIQKIIERELNRIQKEQERLAKEKEKRKRLQEIEEREKEVEQRRQPEIKKSEIIHSQKIKKEITRDKSDEIARRRQELLDKVEKKETKQTEQEEKGIGKGKAEKRQLAILEKYRRKTFVASKKGKKTQIKALYKEGFYCYKIGWYNLALSAFNKILELDPTQIKAADYIYIYIPEAEKDAKIKDR